jgi:hypothetical protein
MATVTGMTSPVILIGAGPFQLPEMQRATARAQITRVEVTLYADVEGREGNPEPISFQMLAGPARELAVRLLEAVREIERKGGAT